MLRQSFFFNAADHHCQKYLSERYGHHGDSVLACVSVVHRGPEFHYQVSQGQQA